MPNYYISIQYPDTILCVLWNKKKLPYTQKTVIIDAIKNAFHLFFLMKLKTTYLK